MNVNSHLFFFCSTFFECFVTIGFVFALVILSNGGAMPVAASTLAGSAASYAAAIAGGLTVARAITHKVLEWKFTRQLEGVV